MDKFQNEEKVGFYYESSQDFHLADSDWYPSSQESECDCDSQPEEQIEKTENSA